MKKSPPGKQKKDSKQRTEVRLAILEEKSRKTVREEVADLKTTLARLEERLAQLESQNSGPQALADLAAGLQSNLQRNNDITYKNVVTLAQGQVAIENQYMVSLRAIFRVAATLKTESGDPVLSYDALNQDFELWHRLRERPDFKDHYAAFVTGDFTAETLAALPPVSPEPVPVVEDKEDLGDPVGTLVSIAEADSDTEKLSARYGGADIFGGDELERYLKEQADAASSSKDG